MTAMLRCVAVLCSVLFATGCAHHDRGGMRPPTPQEEGWTRLGRFKAAHDQGQDIVTGDHLPGVYRTLRIDSDGPVQVDRVIVSFDNGYVYLPTSGLIFNDAGSQMIDLPNDKRIELVMVVHSGGRLLLGTSMTLWVK